MKKVLFISNIPAPYRIDFFNELGKRCELTVLFEARRAEGIRFNWNEDGATNFRTVFLSDGNIDETRVDRRIFSYIKKGMYDHIVATSYGYYTETAALLYMRMRGVHYDLEIDGGVVRPAESPVKRFLKRRIIRGATHLFSSGKQADRLFLHYGARKEQLVRYPFTSLFDQDLLESVPSAAQKLMQKQALGVPYKTMVLSVGQFIRRKGFDVLIRAARALPEDAGVYIVGGAPTEEYRSLLEEYSLNNVRFVEFMDKRALAGWFLAADVFTLPTREDMWGLVINEAMANALPVVTTDRCVAGVELVADGVNGYLVPVEDPVLLATRIREILDDDALRASMAAESLKRIRSSTIEQMARVHERVFYGGDS